MKGSIWINWLAYTSVLLSGDAFNATSKDADSSKNKDEDPRIVGGFYANHNDFPFIVSVQVFYSDWSHHCGGSIVTPRIVLTASHCMTHSSNPIVYRHPQTFRVVAGTGHLFAGNPNEQDVRVSQLIAHPRYNTTIYTNDAGVLVLTGSLSFNRYVQPMNLYSRNIETASSRLWYMERDKKSCLSPGWGSYDGVNYGTKLKYTPVTLMSSNDCAKTNCYYRHSCNVNYWQNRQVCAIHARGIFCHGDSGGPLVCDGQVFGVVSYHYGCVVGRPMMYTDIVPILQVVERYLNQ